jgi:hypothetical protein
MIVPKPLIYCCARHAGRIESDAVYQESEASVCEDAYRALETGTYIYYCPIPTYRSLNGYYVSVAQ